MSDSTKALWIIAGLSRVDSRLFIKREARPKQVIFHEKINRYYNFLVALTDCFQPIKCISNSDEISQMERVKNLQVVLGETGK